MEANNLANGGEIQPSSCALEGEMMFSMKHAFAAVAFSAICQTALGQTYTHTAEDAERFRQQLETAKAKLDSFATSRELRLKGLYPGIAFAEAETFHPGITNYCRDQKGEQPEPYTCAIRVSGSDGIYEFRHLYSIADAEAQGWLFNIVGGKIWAITVLVTPAGATEIGPALAQKYKNGTVSTPSVKNRMGAEFSNPTWQFKSGSMALEVRKYATTLEYGSI